MEDLLLKSTSSNILVSCRESKYLTEIKCTPSTMVQGSKLIFVEYQKPLAT